ncbi:DNA-3-methyladenine glycosylase [Alicyclobacillus sp. SO9]|uniref:DNA-3-methyladenine glycosylase family protein n=1 Tax=Alicyclobacillus sp. SO9 TaxID=2665646 RepID=UPI0018E82A12|nr:DNA-3-methyladenine glycosylase [Alicyclobacillus sp. SO9]QQE80034.1 DNA-3-methyladenine glycosylase 2 family protein [Alicyclobacillus sp. SO9]
MDWSDHQTFIVLQTPKDFRFAANLQYLNRSETECMHVVENDRVYKLLHLDNQDLVMEISAIYNHCLQVRFVHQIPSKRRTRVAAAAYVWDWFDLDRNLSDFYQMAQNDVVLHQAVKKFRGLSLIGVPDFFEALCWTIIGQQINLPFAYTLKQRLVELCGRPVNYENQTYWTFPSPEQVANLSIDALRELQFTVRKAEYLIGVAASIVTGELSRAQFLNMSGFDQAYKALQNVRGIGPWSANYVLMRHFRDEYALPAQDVGLQNAVKIALQMQRKPTVNEVVDIAEHWGHWKSYATFYLWMTLFAQV